MKESERLGIPLGIRRQEEAEEVSQQEHQKAEWRERGLDRDAKCRRGEREVTDRKGEHEEEEVWTETQES